MTAEYWIRRGLIDAGMERAVASCIADRTTDALDFADERRLVPGGSEAKSLRAATVEQLLAATRGVVDPDIHALLAEVGPDCSTPRTRFDTRRRVYRLEPAKAG